MSLIVSPLSLRSDYRQPLQPEPTQASPLGQPYVHGNPYQFLRAGNPSPSLVACDPLTPPEPKPPRREAPASLRANLGRGSILVDPERGTMTLSVRREPSLLSALTAKLFGGNPEADGALMDSITVPLTPGAEDVTRLTLGSRLLSRDDRMAAAFKDGEWRVYGYFGNGEHCATLAVSVGGISRPSSSTPFAPSPREQFISGFLRGFLHSENSRVLRAFTKS